MYYCTYVNILNCRDVHICLLRPLPSTSTQHLRQLSGVLLTKFITGFEYCSLGQQVGSMPKPVILQARNVVLPGGN